MVRLVVLSILMLFSSWSFGQLGQSMLLDPKALSLGNAVTADPPGIASIHYNPAGLTRLEGRQIGISLLNVILHSEAVFNLPEDYDGEGELLDFSEDPTIGQTSEAIPGLFIPGVGIFPLHLPVAAVPSGGFSIQPPGSKFTFANSVYMPMVAGFVKEGSDNPGRYQAKQLAMQRMTYLSPSVAYKVSDELSVGASFFIVPPGFCH